MTMAAMLLAVLTVMAALCSASSLTYSVESSSSVKLLDRPRRQVAEESIVPPKVVYDPDDLGLQTPLNETEEGKKEDFTIETSENLYYNLNYHPANKPNFESFWVDIDALIKKFPNTSHANHTQLASSYRRAVSLQFSFDFPFYGHALRNLTIATGGFCYVGDQMHSWLAATQYIAPLMSNFDTTPANSSILYSDTGSMMVVEWRDVVLRNQPDAGEYTFQVSLHMNGTIWFVYKKVPVSVDEISDTHHPKKVGLSDAYLYEHKIGFVTPTMGKRVIYEYHRIEIPHEKVASFAVIEIIPVPVCISLTTCESCVNSTLANFNCSWCSGAEVGSAFCSDENGLHRRRQEWTTGNCGEKSSSAYCTDDQDTTPAPEAPTTTTPNAAPAVPRAASAAPPRSATRREEAVVVGGAGGGGVVALLVLLVLCVVLGGWLTYAYFNPHTPSGQMLIKYRPGRWRMPGNHGDVRYTASVHM